jgi:vitamin B12 transporter
LFDDRFDQTLGVSFKDEHRHYAYGSDQNTTPKVYGGYSEKIDWQGNVKVVSGETVTMGAERFIESIDNLKPAKFTANTGNTAGFLQLQSKIEEHFANTVSVRRDENDQFGGANTYRIAPAVLIPETGSKIKGSIGTGFKAPSLDQLYDNYPNYAFYANPNLKPEKSLGYDIGFDQNLLSDKIQFGSTYFHNNIKNLIVSVYNSNYTFGTYQNVSSAVTKGVENYISYQPLEILTLRANYTYTLTDNLSGGYASSQLVERPKHKTGVSAIWQATDEFRLTVTETGTSNWFAYNYAKGSGWWTTNVAGDYRINDNFSIFGRVDNLLDRKYQMQTDYQAPGIGVFGGIKVKY